MAKEGSRDRVAGETAEALEVIREECSPAVSSVNMNTPKTQENVDHTEPCTNCKCLEHIEKSEGNINKKQVEELIMKNEKTLAASFQENLNTEIKTLRERADFILQNEQVRASYMLREAHRERQEKITALQTQLECKNLAGMMFVMCSERQKSKMEKLRLIEEYTSYIHGLQDILTEAQSLILNLSRGFKTAARVEREWRDKMKKILTEFQMFVHDYTKGTPESEQYFFDIPDLMKTNAPIVDNPKEDPCRVEEECLCEQEEVSEKEKQWYERFDEDPRPFVLYGDIGDFKPNDRRKVLKDLKEVNKSLAPPKWKEYVFNEMYVKADCENADAIKDELPNLLPPPMQWDCQLLPVQQDTRRTSAQGGGTSRRTTTASVDVRGTMGSILKIITSTNVTPKATILGARDSMEITSTSKLREKHKHNDHGNVVINVGSRRTSFFEESERIAIEEEESEDARPSVSIKEAPENIEEDDSYSELGSVHNDSLSIIHSHIPELDHKIHYEKICPMEKCQRMQMGSFVRSLPYYMRANPFTHIEQTYEEYEVCTQEQLEILKERIERKKRKEKSEYELFDENPLEEWSPNVDGVGTQTSGLSVLSLPPCTCRGPQPSLADNTAQMFKLENLVPVKQALNKIHQECFYDSNIEFDRFKVIGQESDDTVEEQKPIKTSRLQEVTKVLKQHPSLLDIFQGNAV